MRISSIVPLHFGGKIFHWFFFAAIEGGRRWKGLCVGLGSAGGFLGWAGSLWDRAFWWMFVFVCVCERVKGRLMSLRITPSPLAPRERTNYHCDPRAIITHLYLQLPLFGPYLLHGCRLSFFTYRCDKCGSFTNIWQELCLCSPKHNYDEIWPYSHNQTKSSTCQMFSWKSFGY